MKKVLICVAFVATAVSVAFGTLIVMAAQTANLVPTSDGAYRGWFSSTGTSGYTNVDDTSCNGTVDYNYTTNTSPVWNRESYRVNLSSVTNTSVISGITITPCISAHTSGTSTIDVFYRYNGANSSYLGNYTVSGTTPFTVPSSTWSGLSLLKTATSTLDIGIRLTSGVGGGRVSKMSVMLTY